LRRWINQYDRNCTELLFSESNVCDANQKKWASIAFSTLVRYVGYLFSPAISMVLPGSPSRHTK